MAAAKATLYRCRISDKKKSPISIAFLPVLTDDLGKAQVLCFSCVKPRQRHLPESATALRPHIITSCYIYWLGTVASSLRSENIGDI